MTWNICNAPGCRQKTPDRYCPDHQRQPQPVRESPSIRGYDRAWYSLMDYIKGSRRWCADCLTAGRLTLGTEGHHVRKIAEFPELRLAEENVLLLCHDCHCIRTARGE